MGIRKQRHHFITIAHPQAIRSYYITLILVFVLLLPVFSPAAVYVAGDLAPIGAPDDELNIADILILQRIIVGDLTPSEQDILIGDVAPIGATDGQLNVADVAVLMRAMYGEISLAPVVIRPDAPELNLLPATTNDNPLTVTGISTPNIKVKLYVNGLLQATIMSSATDGSFSFSAVLIDGVNSIYATTWDGLDESLPSDSYFVDYQNILLRDINSANNNLTISSDTVLTPGSTPIPYTITGTLTVSTGSTLTLQPGVILEFGSSGRLQVQAGASLVVQGTATNKVIFTSSGAKAAYSEWGGIIINSNSELNRIEHADIRYAYYGVRFNAGATGEIHNSTITTNYYGIYATGDSSPIITWNNIYNNGPSFNIGRDYFAYGFTDTTNTILNAKNNWWGTFNPAEIEGRVTNYTDYPNQSPYVDYTGYLDAFDGTPAPVLGEYLIGEIKVDTMLAQDTRYIILGDLHIPAGVTLTIPEGAELQFAGSLSNLIVDGTLIVLGASGNKVKFLSTSQKYESEWYGIEVNIGGVVSIDYADIRYAEIGIAFNPGSQGEIYNSTITLNGSGVSFVGDRTFENNPTAIITGNNIYDNGVYLSNGNIRHVPGADFSAKDFSDEAKSITLNAKNNWWGSADPQIISQRIFDFTDNSYSSPVVDYSYFLDGQDGVPIEGNFLNGMFSVDTTLVRNMQYVVLGDLYVPNGVTLTIPDGVMLSFGCYSCDLSIDGILNVQGVETNNVSFTSSKGLRTWDGIQVNEGGEVNIEYSDIRYANYGLKFNAGSAGEIHNSTVTENSYGIYALGNAISGNSIPVVTGNSIYSNSGRNYVADYFVDIENTVLDARNNWWGTNDPSAIADQITDHADQPTRSPHIDYSGFLDTPSGVQVSDNYLGGVLTVDTTLTANTRYTILGDLDVPTGVILTIPAGVELHFAGASSNLKVDGELIVQGTLGSEVIFTSGKTSPMVGDWEGIQVNSGASITMDYAVIEYAKYGIYFNSASGTVSNSLIQFNTTGIYITGSYVIGTSSPELVNNRIIYNSDYGIQIIGTYNDDTNPKPKISSNDIYANTLGGVFVNRFGFNTTSNIVLDMTLNWWGTATPAEGQQILYGSYASGVSVDFSGYVATPLQAPALISASVSELYFSPNGDNVKDLVVLTGTLNESSAWTVGVYNSSGQLVQTLPPGTGTSISATWDGRNTSGQIVADGKYYFLIAANAGGREGYTGSQWVVLDNTAPTTGISSPADNGTLTNVITVPVVGTAVDANFVSYRVEYGVGATPASWTMIDVPQTSQINSDMLIAWVVFNEENPVQSLPNGQYTIQLVATDSAGNENSSRILVTIDNILLTDITTSASSIDVANGESASINFTLNMPGTATLKIYPESQGSTGIPIRTISQTYVAPDTYAIPWDGTDDSGQIISGGAYIFTLDVTDGIRSSRYAPINTVTSSNYVSGSSLTLSFNAYKNEYWSVTDTFPSIGRAQLNLNLIGTGMVIQPDGEGFPVSAGSHTFYWDGRIPSTGELFIGSISYWISYTPYAANTILVNSVGLEPVVGGVGPYIEVKSDPYIVYLSYGQFTELFYNLTTPGGQSADVQIKLLPPGVIDFNDPKAIMIHEENQAPKNYRIRWTGIDSTDINGKTRNIKEDGAQTFAIKATLSNGTSTLTRGVINVYQ